MAHIISILNHKGGVGKTTSAVNIGAGLNLLNKKVLIIDLDPQANLTLHLNFPIQGINNIYGALKEEYPLPVLNIKKGLDIVTSTLDLSVAEMELINEAGREYLLKYLLEPIRGDYDYIIIDCPPSLGLLSLNALSVANSVIIPIDMSSFALAGMSKLFDIYKKVQSRLNSELKFYKILMTKVDGRKVIHKNISEVIEEDYSKDLFKTKIRMNVSLEEAQMQSQDIFAYNIKSTGAEDYREVCKEIIKNKK